MLKKYRNELFNFIKEKNYGIENFRFDENSSESEQSIRFRDTAFSFEFINPENDYHSFYCRFVKYGPTLDFTHYIPTTPQSFKNILSYFKIWFDDHIKEYLFENEGIDLWEQYQQGSKALNLSTIDFDDRSQFSIEEKAQIRLGINELKYLVQQNLQTTAEQQELVNARLDYLIEASDRLNRFDWKGVAATTLISIMIALTLDPEKGRLLFELFQKIFSAVPHLSPAVL